MKAWILSLGEHELLATLDEEGGGRLVRETFRRARTLPWAPASQSDARHLKAPESEVVSLRAFTQLVVAQCEEAFGEAAPRLARLATKRVTQLLKEKKSQLVRAWAFGFEGNHNDTMFIVGLEAPARSLRKKAAPQKPRASRPRRLAD